MSVNKDNDVQWTPKNRFIQGPLLLTWSANLINIMVVLMLIHVGKRAPCWRIGIKIWQYLSKGSADHFHYFCCFVITAVTILYLSVSFYKYDTDATIRYIPKYIDTVHCCVLFSVGSDRFWPFRVIQLAVGQICQWPDGREAAMVNMGKFIKVFNDNW